MATPSSSPRKRLPTTALVLKCSPSDGRSVRRWISLLAIVSYDRHDMECGRSFATPDSSCGVVSTGPPLAQPANGYSCWKRHGGDVSWLAAAERPMPPLVFPFAAHRISDDVITRQSM